MIHKIKTLRRLTPKDNQLVLRYGKTKEHSADLVAYNGKLAYDGPALLLNALARERYEPDFHSNKNIKVVKSVLDELDEKGFDLSTLKFSIELKE